MMKKKVVLAGGSGFLGKALADYFHKQLYEVIILSRKPTRIYEGISYVQWDGQAIGEWVSELEGADAVFNFTGKSVNCIYTSANREEIMRSRLDSVAVLSQAIRSCMNPPPVFVQAGSLAIFGDTTDVCDETSSHGKGFSVEVCQQWEQSFFTERFPQTRQVMLRIGFVLGANGGALKPLMKLAKSGLGGTVGKGNQYISWIHLEDMNRLFQTVMEDDTYSGVYNATGPSPVTNRVFMKTLRDAAGKGWAIPTPSLFVRIGAYLVMRTEPSLALTGRNCIPARLEKQGFSFTYIDLDETLRQLVAEQNHS